MFTVIIVAGVLFVSAQNAKLDSNSLLAQNIEALGREEDGQEWGCGGNPTYTKNESLKSDPCINGGTHLKCKDDEGVCCDPSKQTDCGGIGGILKR